MKNKSSPILVPQSRKLRSKLSNDWQKLAQAELNLRADEQAVLKLKDKALHYILAPLSKLPASKMEYVRERRTKWAFQTMHEMVVGLGFQFAGWDEEEGFRIYEKLSSGGNKIRVEWGYFETKEGVKRHFKYEEMGKSRLTMKRDFLLMIVRTRKKNKK